MNGYQLCRFMKLIPALYVISVYLFKFKIKYVFQLQWKLSVKTMLHFTLLKINQDSLTIKSGSFSI